MSLQLKISIITIIRKLLNISLSFLTFLVRFSCPTFSQALPINSSGFIADILLLCNSVSYSARNRQGTDRRGPSPGSTWKDGSSIGLLGSPKSILIFPLTRLRIRSRFVLIYSSCPLSLIIAYSMYSSSNYVRPVLGAKSAGRSFIHYRIAAVKKARIGLIYLFLKFSLSDGAIISISGIIVRFTSAKNSYSGYVQTSG